MRYVRLELTPPAGAVHPVGRRLATEPGLERAELIYVDSFPDGTGILLYRLRGSAENVGSRLEEHPLVLEWDLFEGTGTDVYCYLSVDSGEPASTLMSLVGRDGLIVETPIEFIGSDSLRLTVAGKEELIQHAYQEIPDDFDDEIIKTGEYDPTCKWSILDLTTRQQEVLRTAVEIGYYDVPKRATHQDIANELDCATSTVDEHLRKAESSVFLSLLG
ncbi:helix-turn-helix domain-containing protein [Natrinema salaciae]|uniref:HTH DNA binding domain-containing protein n=1 Tax=Natrinema salaciae TaxID=1186196 RepID=A0A1H9M5Z1_9EURY|nr:helix-turn-helix domain-containing protein [Natrinema salaciae]SER19118.1 HTH DNA binding domain-containing protein [Natrinema salaciae]